MKTLNLIIVDDEIAIRNGLKNAVDWQSLRINVIATCKNGKEAFKMIKRYKPDIVITDIKMPEQDGLSLIKETFDSNFDTKFIILSGFNDFQYAQSAIKYHVTSYLLKPVRKKVLLDEIKRIQHDIYTESMQKQSMSQLNSALDALKEKFYISLHNQEITNLDVIEKERKNLNIQVSLAPVKVIVFEFILPTHAPKSQFTKNDNKLFKFALKNIIGEIENFPPCDFYEQDVNKVIAVFNDSNGTAYDFNQICDQCLNIIKNYTNTIVYAGVGLTVDNISKLRDSYDSAINALSYRLYVNTQYIFNAENFYHKENKINPPINFNNVDLVNAIVKYDKTLIEKNIDMFFDQIFAISKPSPEYIKNICVVLIVNIFNEISVITKSPNLNSTFSYEMINEIQTLESLREWLLNFLINTSLFVQEKKKDEVDPIIQKAQEYIENHMNDRVLLEDVAQHVHLSESYLALLFKKNIGQTFREYVLNCKIAYAKNLLKTTTKSIAEISELTGYSDYRSFNRVFKKMVGKTPTEYSNIYH